MYAIVKIAGFQFKVKEQQRILVPRLDVPVGEKISIPEVLLISDDGKTMVGTPTVPGASVEAKVLSHRLGKKIIVFKMKRRKDYRRKKGYRARYTEILIEGIHIKQDQGGE